VSAEVLEEPLCVFTTELIDICLFSTVQQELKPVGVVYILDRGNKQTHRLSKLVREKIVNLEQALKRGE
jgi:nucleosome binding factor SPN SPT16 subunit